jgi:Na+/H+-translocating membrane pyrophosphatase
MSKDNDFSGMGGDPKPKGGMGAGAIIGIVVGVLLLCCCLSCCGGIGLNWDEFKKGFDKGFQEGMKKGQQK